MDATSIAVDTVPLVGMAPVQLPEPPDAVQEVAFVLDHVRLAAEFHATLAGDAVSVTDAAGGGGGGGAAVDPPPPQAASVRDTTTRQKAARRWRMMDSQYPRRGITLQDSARPARAPARPALC